MLIEGIRYGEYMRETYSAIQDINNTIFSTTDSQTLKTVLNENGINYVVCRPNTDLKIKQSNPDWLKRLDATGTLIIYKVN